ncbi:inactive tyrosine-protein kinase PRAG1 [Hemibagrus wyckioides]|uniref:inactive tyrosine-protein kinase PRAG1 n=1 Tax=Hemibagrus wyckioides TaxID=337641 RepID=UPI00266CFA10|nr:inactive tyrosine-protein kinase PRAG1 [Hemibagrus wyckioides]
MSACSEFAEHVWKPGSCKNCFHPRSAHANTRGRKSLCRDEEEDEGASASTHIKPTIAVKPTMMNLDTTEKTAEFTMNTQQAHKSSIGLKNILDLSSLYISSNGCSTTLKDMMLQNGISTKLDYSSRTPASPKAPPNPGCVFIMQEDCRSPIGLKENFSPQVAKTPKCTYITSCDSLLHHHKQEVQVIINTATGNINGTVNGASAETHSVLSSPVASPESLNNAGVSDLFSHCSSSDSLPGLAAIQSEPIYAESSKRKCRPRRNADLITEVSDDADSQRATITVMAAHTEENNRTFYLSSPDSAVSTQWRRFSPTTPDDPSSPVFSWPSSPVVTGTTPLSADLSGQTETKASPPIPPKRNSRSPKLGTSSLSPLPELNFHVSPPLKLSQGEAHSSCPVLSSLWSSEPRAEEERREEEKKKTEREWKDKCDSTPGTDERNNSPSEKQAEMKSDSSSSEPRPPLPPPKKHHRSCVKLSVSSMELDHRGSVESLPHSMKEMNTTSSDSLPALNDSVVQESTQHSCPSLFPSPSLCPPPLPEKKLLSRTTSSDIETKFRSHSVTSCSSPQLSYSSSASLQTLLSGGASRECVYARLGGLYGECVRRLSLKCEERFTHTQKHTHRFFNEHEWSLFKLSCSHAVCVTRDAAYYPASCSSDMHTPYAVKICKGHTQEVRRSHLFGLSVQQSIPPHFNLQQDCGHFIACVPLSMLPGQEETLAPPSSPASTTPLDQQERVVVITRDVPSQSVADFVSEYQSFHRSHPEVYERRVCFLLLQLCNALEHLKAHGVTHRDLCLENMILVPQRQPVTSNPTHQEPLPRLLISNFSKAKRRCETDEKQRAELTRMAPEIVSASQYRKVDEFQTGILIYEMLHLPNPFEAVPSLRNRHYRIEELPSIPSVSIYSSGLERLARLLLRPDPDERIHIAEAKRGLQSLLWGPRRELLDRVTADNRKDKDQDTLLNWLDVKRALLMMKFAERSLEPEKSPELEDWLCCQYFSNTHPPSLLLTAQMMHLIKPTH